MFKIYDGRSQFYQWDLDRKLIVNDATITQVHFCNRTDDCSLVCETYTEDGKNIVNVPNVLLQSDWRINVYAYDAKYTKFSAQFDVVRRTKPTDYVYTETETLNFNSMLEQVNETIDERMAAIDEYLDGYATEEYVDEQIMNVATGGTIDMSKYATKEYVENMGGGKVDGITIQRSNDGTLSTVIGGGRTLGEYLSYIEMPQSPGVTHPWIDMWFEDVADGDVLTTVVTFEGGITETIVYRIPEDFIDRYMYEGITMNKAEPISYDGIYLDASPQLIIDRDYSDNSDYIISIDYIDQAYEHIKILNVVTYFGYSTGPEIIPIKADFVPVDGVSIVINDGKLSATGITGGEIDLSDYATKEYVDEAIAGIEPGSGDIDIDLSEYATIQYVDDAIAAIPTSTTELNPMYFYNNNGLWDRGNGWTPVNGSAITNLIVCEMDVNKELEDSEEGTLVAPGSFDFWQYEYSLVVFHPAYSPGDYFKWTFTIDELPTGDNQTYTIELDNNPVFTAMSIKYNQTDPSKNGIYLHGNTGALVEKVFIYSGTELQYSQFEAKSIPVDNETIVVNNKRLSANLNGYATIDYVANVMMESGYVNEARVIELINNAVGVIENGAY